ncbi:MAG: serine/threonine-protein kinase [Gammaproteobacteria bacterium]|nr:serine/threonine-protein kinase [Gammaproteobacteria bacterium]
MNKAIAEQAERIFLEASSLEPGEREVYVARACAGNMELQQEVMLLLDGAARSSRYFAELPDRLGIPELLDDLAESAVVVGSCGQQFGPYTLTTHIGSGGMGAVWHAVRSDGQFEGEVAIKLLAQKSGSVALQRFSLEGRYLAKLTHANIARLLDAGVAEGNQPYLVLEYVDGTPIDQYCDAQNLDIEHRIRLFLFVLEAVAHAHAHLIVHRDIKPSNVLITRDGTVKLLDFGVAKLLSDNQASGGHLLTREMGAALTPEFAAPEQLAGTSITTATDVYSLGLLLWLLVTGKSPRDTATIKSLSELRAVANSEPASMHTAVTEDADMERVRQAARRRSAAPSEFLKTLRTDLDTVVRKALAPEPNDRYATAEAFASDLQHYLRNEPVIAQNPTVVYRARKFVRRHRGGVLTAMLMFTALVSAAIITTWQSVEARRQRDNALYQQQRVQASNEFLQLLLSEIGPDSKPLTLVELLDRGVALLDRQFGAEERFIGRTLYDVSLFYATLGKIDEQVALLERASGIASELEDWDLLATVTCAQARAQLMNDMEVSGARLQQGKQALQKTRFDSADGKQECFRAEALLLEAAGDRDGAINAFRSALTAIESSPVRSDAARATILNDLAEQYFKADRANEALAVNAELLEIMDRTGRGGTLGTFIYLLNRAAILSRMGEVREASVAQLQAMQRVESLEATGQTPVGAWAHYANSLLRLGRYDEALSTANAGLEAATAAANSRWVAGYEMLIGKALARAGRGAEAGPHLAVAESIYSETAGANERLLDAIALTRAEISLRNGDEVTARDAIMAILNKTGYPQRKEEPGLASILWTTANMALATGDAVAAEQYATDNLQIVSAVARDPTLSADVGQALLQRAKARHMLGRNSDAVRDLERAIPSLVNGFGDEHSETAEARELLTLLMQ